MNPRPPLPPFTESTARQKVQMAENWEFDALGYMARRFASINDQRIREEDRKFRWPHGPRPTGEPRLADLDL